MTHPEDHPDIGIQRNAYDLKVLRAKQWGTVFAVIVLALCVLSRVYRVDIRIALDNWAVSSGWQQEVKDRK